MPDDGDGGSATKRTRGKPIRLKPATAKSNSSNAMPAKPVAKGKKGGEVPAQVRKKKPAKRTVEKRTRTAVDKEEEEEEEEEEKEEEEGDEGDDGEESEYEEEEDDDDEGDEESEEDEDDDGVGIDSAAGDNEAEEAGRRKIAAQKKKKVLDLLF